jgi:hypothetical protein
MSTSGRPRIARRRSFGERVVDAFGLVVLCLLATFVFASLTSYSGWGGVVTTFLCGVSAVVALVSASASPRVIVWGARFAALGVVLALIGAITGSQSLFGIGALMSTAALSIAAWSVLRTVVGSREVGFRTILGAVSVYITLGLLYAFLYVGIDRIQNAPFFGPNVVLKDGDFLFFSMTTLTTTGYGNLVPAGQPGKIFTVFEMLMGQIFLVTLIARLVSMWRPGDWLGE